MTLYLIKYCWYSGTSHIRMEPVEGADQERQCETGLVQLNVFHKAFHALLCVKGDDW